MRIAWYTDVHLNFVSDEAVAGFIERANALRVDATLIGGDIAEAPTLLDYLRALDEGLRGQVYFVLGNHDYYHGSIAEVRRQVRAFCAASQRLHWLNAESAITLTPTLGLVGHDGWADARLGDYERSLVMMNDYRLIAELACHDKKSRWPVLQGLGDEAAEHFRQVLPPALAQFREVLLLTHVPPFREACWHEGRTSDDQWAPHFTCQAVGQTLQEIMRAHPDRLLTVLCGHTHGDGETWLLDNLHVVTGGAQYGAPSVQRVLEA